MEKPKRGEDGYDLCLKALKEEYVKYSTRLSVNCISEYQEMEKAVPVYRDGTMTVVAGPPMFRESALKYLRDKDYPMECVCELP